MSEKSEVIPQYKKFSLDMEKSLLAPQSLVFLSNSTALTLKSNKNSSEQAK